MFFSSFIFDIFFLIANAEINMTIHSFPVSSHAKVAWAINSFCCLYYLVENRENLALSQVLKSKVKNETELSLGKISEQTSAELQDLHQSSRGSLPPKSLAKYQIMCFTVVLDFHFLTKGQLPKAGTMFLILVMRWRVCNILPFTLPQFSKARRHVTETDHGQPPQKIPQI